MLFECFLSLLLLALGGTVASSRRTEQQCRPIPLQDIQDAVHASISTYGSLKNDDVIPGTSGYRVTKVMDFMVRRQMLHGIIATKTSPPTTMICFEGTDAFEEGVQQFLSIITKSMSDVTLRSGHRFKVIDYYWEAINVFNNEMLETSRNWSNDTKFLVTGHSLGGALASLYSLLLLEKGLWNNPDSAMINFGTPRHGDASFAHAHDQLIPYHRKIRLVYDRDIVAHIPTHNIIFTTFWHSAREVWVDQQTTRKFKWIKKGWIWVPWYETIITEEWKVCPANGETKECSNNLFWLSIADHKMKIYIKAVNSIIKDVEKSKKFISDQCSISTI